MAEAARDTATAPRSLLARVLGAGGPLEPEDERVTELDKVGDLVTRGAYAEAGKAAEALLRQGVHDVRLVGPYLFGAFLEPGPACMDALFASLLELLNQRWEGFGPVGKKELVADNGLRWLFKAMSKHLEYHERRKEAVWKAWCTPRSREPLREALELSNPLLAALSTKLAKNGSVAPFRQLVSWLQTFLRALPPDEPVQPPSPPVASPAAPEPPMPAPTPPAPEPPHKVAATEEAPDEEAPEDEEREHEEPAARGPMLPVSPALALLMRKLQAFEELVRREDFFKAGVVASDVLTTVEQFDPRVYLPALFTPFFARLSTHAQALEPLMQDSSSLSFRALQQLYQVDLDAFLAQEASGGAEVEE